MAQSATGLKNFQRWALRKNRLLFFSRIPNQAGAWPYLWAAVAGLLLTFSMPPFGWWPLAFLGLALWLHIISKRTFRSRLGLSSVVGVVLFLVTLIWVWDLSVVGYGALVLFFGVLFYGLAGMLIPASKARWLAFPAVLVLAELIRWRWPFGGVPLSTIPMALVDSPLSHTVRFLGSGLLVLLAAVGGVVLAALVQRHYLTAGIFAGVLLAAAVFSGFAPDTSAAGEKLDIAVVQGGGPQRVRSGSVNPRVVFERHQKATQLVQGPVDLLVWPENVVDVVKFEGSSEQAWLSNWARQNQAYILAGVVEDVDSDTFANLAVLIDSEGRLVDEYEKVRRVPFGEYVPFRSLVEPLAPSFLPDTEARVGSGPAVVKTGSYTLGTIISWEIFFEDRARAAARAGAEVLINPTNNSTYWLSIVQSQQVASTKLRAKETGLWVVQAAPTGFSVIVDSSGKVQQKIAIGRQGVSQMSVELRTGKTLATRLGPYPMLGLSLFLLALAWLLHFYSSSEKTFSWLQLKRYCLPNRRRSL